MLNIKTVLVLAVLALAAPPLAAQENPTRGQQEIQRTIELRKAQNQRKAQGRALKRARLSAEAERQRQYEARMAPLRQRQYEAEVARQLAVYRLQIEEHKARAEYAKAAALQRMADALYYDAWRNGR